MAKIDALFKMMKEGGEAQTSTSPPKIHHCYARPET